MIAVDTNSIVAFFHDQEGKDVQSVEFALDRECLVLPPTVLTELLSDHRLSNNVTRVLQSIPLLEIEPNFWRRVGENRAKILKRGFRARLADTLIAQTCIDNKTPLITRDHDFRHFAKLCGLELFSI